MFLGKGGALMAKFVFKVMDAVMCIILFGLMLGVLQEAAAVVESNANVYSVAVIMDETGVKFYYQIPGQGELKELSPGMSLGGSESVNVPSVQELRAIARMGETRYLHVLALDDEMAFGGRIVCRGAASCALIVIGNLMKCSMREARAVLTVLSLGGAVAIASIALWRARRQQRLQDDWGISSVAMRRYDPRY